VFTRISEVFRLDFIEAALEVSLPAFPPVASDSSSRSASSRICTAFWISLPFAALYNELASSLIPLFLFFFFFCSFLFAGASGLASSTRPTSTSWSVCGTGTSTACSCCIWRLWNSSEQQPQLSKPQPQDAIVSEPVQGLNRVCTSVTQSARPPTRSPFRSL